MAGYVTGQHRFGLQQVVFRTGGSNFFVHFVKLVNAMYKITKFIKLQRYSSIYNILKIETI